MKNLKKFLMILIMTIFLTGCVKVESNMTISKNKKMDFEIVMTLDKDEFIANGISNDDIIDETQRKELENQGFTIKEYDENNRYGYIISKNYDNIDYLSSPDVVDYDLESVINDPLSTAYIFKVKKGFVKNKYTAQYDLSNSQIGLYDITFKVSVPYKGATSNATRVENDGKDLIWDLSDTSKPVEFEFEIYNITNVVAIVLAITIVILLSINFILTVIFKLSKKDNNKVSSKKVKKVKNKENNTSKRRFIMSNDSNDNSESKEE